MLSIVSMFRKGQNYNFVLQSMNKFRTFLIKINRFKDLTSLKNVVVFHKQRAVTPESI